MQAERCTFYVRSLEYTNTHFHNIFVHVFDVVKNAKKRRSQQKKCRGTRETRYPSGLI